jgi:phage major head subunit gpT-like protein
MLKKTFGIWLGLIVAMIATFAAAPAFAHYFAWKVSAGKEAVYGVPMCMGMLINAGTIQNIFINLKTTFMKVFDATPAVWQKIATRVPSTGAQNDYSWLQNFPAMKRWLDEKVVKALKALKYVLVNDDFEATVEVDRNHIEDDQVGIYAPQAEMAGFSAKQFPDEGVMAVVSAGFTEKCYDGQYFYDTDHPVVDPATKQPVSVSNKGTAVLSIASLEAAQASYGAARIALRKMKNDDGQSLNVTPSILLVPPGLGDTARILMTAKELFSLATGKPVPNPYMNTAEVIEDARLATDTEWHLLDCTKPLKPFIYQDRKSPTFVNQVDMSSDSVFLRKKYRFGCEARAAFGFGFWQMAYGSTGTVEI